MKARAGPYIWAVLLLGGALDIQGLSGLAGIAPRVWLTCVVFGAAAMIAQARAVRASGHASLHLTPALLFAGALLLPPGLLVPIAVGPPLVEWAWHRWLIGRQATGERRHWWIHAFNSAMYTIMACGARAADIVLGGTGGAPSFATPRAAGAAAVAALIFIGLNYAIGGLGLILTKRLSWRATGVLDPDNLAIELSVVGLGCALAALWWLAPWFALAVCAPVGLMHRALAVPRLRREAQLDAKTGLAAPRHFDALLAAEVERARRSGRPLALLMADLDRFKALNDNHGHLAGDMVLAEIARIVRATLRRGDVAGRFGGEEFAVLLRDTDAAIACAVAERLRTAVASAHFITQAAERPLRTTVSIGVATFPCDGDTPADLLRAADAAAYRAKAAGRNCVIAACGAVTPGVPEAVQRLHGANVDADGGGEQPGNVAERMAALRPAPVSSTGPGRDHPDWRP